MDYDYAVSFLAGMLPDMASIFFIHSSSLGAFPDILEGRIEYSCDQIPHFPPKKNETETPLLIFGKVYNTYVLVLEGRYHVHEDFSLEEIIFPVKIAYLMGCKHMFITSAAGSINRSFELGDFMIIRGHKVYNEDKSSPIKRGFFLDEGDTWKYYDPNFFKIARRLSLTEGMDTYLRVGVFAQINEKFLEANFDVAVLKTAEADCIGTSVVPEVTAASELNMNIFAMSVIVDKGILEPRKNPAPTPDMIEEAIDDKKDFLVKLILSYVEYVQKAAQTPEA